MLIIFLPLLTLSSQIPLLFSFRITEKTLKMPGAHPLKNLNQQGGENLHSRKTPQVIFTHCQDL